MMTVIGSVPDRPMGSICRVFMDKNVHVMGNRGKVPIHFNILATGADLGVMIGGRPGDFMTTRICNVDIRTTTSTERPSNCAKYRCIQLGWGESLLPFLPHL
jgi:hypothetical protein